MRRARFRRDRPKNLAVGRRHRIDLLPYALIVPTSLLLLAINLYPSLYAIRLTVRDASLLRLGQARCQQVGQCRAFNYVRPGIQGPQAMCWLKSSVPPGTPDPCCVSGVKAAGLPSPPVERRRQ